MKKIILLATILFVKANTYAQIQTTYAEKLGFPKDAKVLIMHVDDVGMSYDSNAGAFKAIEEGIATSMSVMMPCPWFSGFLHYQQKHPTIDAGLHLTFTSEWKDYRWAPISGKVLAPKLVDKEGMFYATVEEVVKNASADDIEMEIRAQLDKARSINFDPTHFDSHMGTLFARPDYLERYIKIGIEQRVPVMFPGGHATMIMKQNATGLTLAKAQEIGKKLWDAGLPVIDDLHNLSYGWNMEGEKNLSDADLQAYKTKKYIESFKDLKPGITMVIMHCTLPTETFEHISDSGNTRKGDLLAMLDPALKKYVEDNGIILTTWRELRDRRFKAK